MNLKEQLKAEAIKLRSQRLDIKKLQQNGKYAGHLQCSQIYLKSNYRHKHIAYSLMRGRTYEQIEPTCRNKPDMDRVKEIINEYSEKDVCASA